MGSRPQAHLTQNTNRKQYKQQIPRKEIAKMIELKWSKTHKCNMDLWRDRVFFEWKVGKWVRLISFSFKTSNSYFKFLSISYSFLVQE